MIDHSFAWWVVLSFGIALLISELFISAFVVMWFGIGAIAVGLVSFVFPGINSGIQILFSVIIGIVLMYSLRGRYLPKSNAEPDDLYTFKATTGKLKVVGDRVSVLANGTFWTIDNIESLDSGGIIDGATVKISGFVDNRATLIIETNQD